MRELSGKLRFIFAAIAVLAVCNFGATIYIQSLQKDDGAIIDAAGRNRMLSQEIGFYAEQILDGDESAKVKLGWAIELHNSSFRALKDGGVATGIAGGRVLPGTGPEVIPKVLAAEELWVEYKKNAEVIAQEPTFIKEVVNPNVQNAMFFLEKNGPDMLALNHAMVESYVSMNDSRQSRLSFVLFALLLLNLVVIFMGAKSARSASDANTEEDGSSR